MYSKVPSLHLPHPSTTTVEICVGSMHHMHWSLRTVMLAYGQHWPVESNGHRQAKGWVVPTSALAEKANPDESFT